MAATTAVLLVELIFLIWLGDIEMTAYKFEHRNIEYNDKKIRYHIVGYFSTNMYMLTQNYAIQSVKTSHMREFTATPHTFCTTFTPFTVAAMHYLSVRVFSWKGKLIGLTSISFPMYTR